MLAAQEGGGLGRQTAEDNVLGVDDEPLARDVAGLGAERTHAYAFASSVVGHPIGHEPRGKGPDRVTTDDHDSRLSTSGTQPV